MFEYWTHALSYVPTRDYRFFVRDMNEHRRERNYWFGRVTPGDLRKVLSRIRRNGALTIRDIDDDVLVEKDHEWASRKPSKRALQLAFYRGTVTVSERKGMLKTYELAERHFGWARRPQAATANGDPRVPARPRPARAGHRQRGFGEPPRRRARRTSASSSRRACAARSWCRSSSKAPARSSTGRCPRRSSPLPEPDAELVHILNPFDPLVLQRKRLQLFFGYEHRFEAYVPPKKRVLGYFAQPVLVGDRIAAVHRPEDRPRARQAAAAEMDLGRQALRQGRPSRKPCTASSASSLRGRLGDDHRPSPEQLALAAHPLAARGARPRVRDQALPARQADHARAAGAARGASARQVAGHHATADGDHARRVGRDHRAPRRPLRRGQARAGASARRSACATSTGCISPRARRSRRSLLKLLFDRIKSQVAGLRAADRARHRRPGARRDTCCPTSSATSISWRASWARTSGSPAAQFSAADIQMSFPLEAARMRGGLDESRPRLMGFLQSAFTRGRPTSARSSAAASTTCCGRRAMSWLMAAVYDRFMRVSEEACLGNGAPSCCATCPARCSRSAPAPARRSASTRRR